MKIVLISLNHTQRLWLKVKKLVQVVTDVIHKLEYPRKRIRVLNSKHLDTEFT